MNMRKAIPLAMFHFRGMIRNRIAFFFNLIMPILFLSIFKLIYGGEEGFFAFIVPGVLTQMILTGGLVTVSINLASYRQTGTLRHLFTTPMSMRDWLFSVTISTYILTGIQAVVIVLVASVVFGAPFPANALSTFVAWFVSSLVALGFGAVIGSFVKTVEAAMSISLISYFLMAFLGGAMMPLTGASPILHTISKLMPSKYMFDMLNETMMSGTGVLATIPNFALLGVVALALLGVATWQTRKQFLSV